MTNIDTIKPASLETVVPFGKYKGRTLGEAMGDREYFDWVSLNLGLQKGMPRLPLR